MEQLEEKLDRHMKAIDKKNPMGAAILSMIFPGLGFFYVGSILKGFTNLMIFVSLIHLAVNGYPEVYSLIIVGFYLFQIFNSFDEAKMYNKYGWDLEKRESMNIPLFLSWIALGLGVALLMANLDFLISYKTITKLWPLILIGLGARTIYAYTKNKKIEEGGENE